MNLLYYGRSEIDARAGQGIVAFLSLAISKQVQEFVQRLPDIKEQFPTEIASAESMTKTVSAQQDAEQGDCWIAQQLATVLCN